MMAPKHSARKWDLGQDIYLEVYWRETMFQGPRVVVAVKVEGSFAGTGDLALGEIHDHRNGMRAQVLSSEMEHPKNRWTIGLADARPNDPDLLKRILKDNDPSHLPFFRIIDQSPKEWQEAIEHWLVLREECGISVLRPITHVVEDS